MLVARLAMVGFCAIAACATVAGLDALDFAGAGGGGDGGGIAGGGAGAATSDGGAGGAPVGWWDIDFATRRRLTITNQTDEAVPLGYQIGLDVDALGIAGDSAPFDGLRVVHRDMGQWIELDRNIDDFGPGMQRVWFALPVTLAAQSALEDVWLYGEPQTPGGTPLEDPTLIFELYDGFEGTDLDSNMWQTTGAIAVLDGTLMLDGAAEKASVVSAYRAFDNFAVDGSMRITSGDSGDIWMGFQRDGDFADASPFLVWIAADGGTVLRPFAHIVPQLDDNGSRSGSDYAHDDQFRYVSVERYSEEVKFVFEDVTVQSWMFSGAYLDPLRIRLNCDNLEPVVFDWIRVRQIRDPSPLVMVGTRETQ